MLDATLTIYTILNVIFGAYLIVTTCINNVLPRKLYKWMAVFFPATITLGIVGWIGYSVMYHIDKRGE